MASGLPVRTDARARVLPTRTSTSMPSPAAFAMASARRPRSACTSADLRIAWNPAGFISMRTLDATSAPVVHEVDDHVVQAAADRPRPPQRLTIDLVELPIDPGAPVCGHGRPGRCEQIGRAHV